jgi:hypothetical protein
MFDNAGNPTTTNISLVTLTGNPNAGGGGRGGGAGFHGNGTDAYVHIATGGGTPWLTVLNANGTLRYSRKVADEGAPDPVTGDVDAAIAADGRVIAVWDDNSAGGVPSPQGRIFGPFGDPVGSIFWLSERDQPAPGGTSTVAAETPRVAWRDNRVAVIWESLNSPATFSRVIAARLFNVPAAPVGPLAPTITSIVNDGPNVTFTWSGGGPTYSVTRRSSVTAVPETLATGLTATTFTTPKTGAEGYYKVSSP